MKREDLTFLHQLIRSREESCIKLEDTYKRKKQDSFNELKKLVFQINKKIAEIVK